MRRRNITLIIHLFAVINTELPGSTNYQIAEYLLKNIQALDISSTASLAKQCNVSKASISRFCKSIGFNDFFEVKAQALYYKRSSNKLNFSFHGMPSDIRTCFLDDTIKKIAAIRDTLENEKIDELTDDLLSGRSITAMGRMQSGNTALNLQHNLFETSGKIIQSLTRIPSIIEYFHTASSDDIAIIFSVSGDFLDDIFYGTPYFIPKKKPKIYLITANPDIDNKSYVDVIYNCKSGYTLSGGNASLDIIQQLITLSYYYSLKK